jgi:hypothetical protein
MYPLIQSTFSWEYFFNRAPFVRNIKYTLGVAPGNNYFLYNLQFSILLWNLRYSSTTGSTTCSPFKWANHYTLCKSTRTFCTRVLRTTKNRCFFSLFDNQPWYQSKWTIFYRTATASSGDQVEMLTINDRKLKLCRSGSYSWRYWHRLIVIILDQKSWCHIDANNFWTTWEFQMWSVITL